MATHEPHKQISIDQLIPGMFVVRVDIPWYRTPFLFHTFRIEDQATVQTMKECGIRTVTIDLEKGIDVPSEKHAPPLSLRTTTASSKHLATAAPAAPPQLKHESVHALYAEAQEAVERMFTDLEQGIPPSPAATKAVVSDVLSHIIADRTAVMTHLAIQRIKQFDRSLAAHALDTCILSLVISVEEELDETTQTRLGTGALLHDIGYVRLPRPLVRRRAECNDQERLLLYQHPSIGLALLMNSPGIDQDILNIVLQHHERGDGSGYPDGLRHERISHLARIVGIVDWYDGMVNRRGGRPAMVPHDAIRRLFLAGDHGWFPKSLVELMIRSIGVYPTGSLVLLNTGEQAVVVGSNTRERLKPLIKIVGKAQGPSYTTPLCVDLANQSQEQERRTILRVLDPTRELVNIAMYLDETCQQAAS